ncbi:hypothetical protein PMAYCL1PPCAC_32107, partial [Pristionchus mayeri]
SRPSHRHLRYHRLPRNVYKCQMCWPMHGHTSSTRVRAVTCANIQCAGICTDTPDGPSCAEFEPEGGIPPVDTI